MQEIWSLTFIFGDRDDNIINKAIKGVYSKERADESGLSEIMLGYEYNWRENMEQLDIDTVEALGDLTDYYAKGGSTYAKGGSLKGHGLAIGDEIIGFDFGEAYVINKGVVFIVDLKNGTRRKTKLSRQDAISKFEKGGNTEDETPVIRYYFEDDAYEYGEGGEIDINDLDLPVHYTMFEEETL